jgi:O-antigen/teichoic acid export membrane protein
VRVPRKRSLRRRLAGTTVVTLGGLVVSIGLQLVIPRVLLVRWGDGGYAVYVAVTGVAAYVSLADAGVQMSLTQRLASLRGSGRDEEALRLARGAVRALSALAVGGVLVLGLALGAFGIGAMRRVVVAGALSPLALFGAMVAQLVSSAVALAAGGWSTAVEQSNEKYSRMPLSALCRALASTTVLLGCAFAGVSSSGALVASACATVPIDLGRFLWARILVQRGPEAAGVREVLSGARGSLLMMLAMSTQAGLWPAVVAAVSPLDVGVAIPSRTIANGARLLSIAAQNILWVPLARRFAANTDPKPIYEFWKRHSPVLALIQMTGVLGLVGVAPAAARLWLPGKAAGIDVLLPFFCAEQALLIATAPSQVLLQAVGRFGRLGAIQFAQAFVGIAATLVLMPHWGALGFAMASAGATAVCVLPGFLAEEYAHWKSMNCRPAGVLGPRLAFAAAGLLCAPTMAYSHGWATLLALVVFFLVSAHALWSVRHRSARAQ